MIAPMKRTVEKFIQMKNKKRYNVEESRRKLDC